MRKIIVAPHVDDEVIGCSQILSSDCIVVYTEKPNPKRRKETEKTIDRFGYLVIFPGKYDIFEILRDRIEEATDECILLAPDPHWEQHPSHKMAGMLALNLAVHCGIRFATYSTDMSTPYIRELTKSTSDRKHQLLDELFPSQRSLWKYDHKYFLFEGIAEWSPKLA